MCGIVVDEGLAVNVRGIHAHVLGPGERPTFCYLGTDAMGGSVWGSHNKSSTRTGTRSWFCFDRLKSSSGCPWSFVLGAHDSLRLMCLRRWCDRGAFRRISHQGRRPCMFSPVAAAALIENVETAPQSVLGMHGALVGW